MREANGPVLLTWLAVRNDPFERFESGGEVRITPDGPVLGPTLTLLTDSSSPYLNRVTDAVVIRQRGPKHEQAYHELVGELAKRVPTLGLHPMVWEHDDPTDHSAIYDYLRAQLPAIRRKFAGRELVLHLSPGTAAMHTVWVLMAETGFIEKPFTAVQSFRLHERRGRPSVVPISLGVDTFFKRWQETRPANSGTVEQGVNWNPASFKSSRLRAVYEDARRVAQLKVPVLILGERGTGKTSLATWIRLNSPFRQGSLDKAWPAVPCGQYTSETMRAELFGYVKGAFTGATGNHAGLLERADGDTLLLDEIGDISRDLQRLLIKVVEEGSYQPLGSNEIKRTDLRLLTATNVPLETLRAYVDADFLDRISTFTVTVPPLREIREELTWLWPEVLRQAAARARAPARYANLTEDLHAVVLNELRTHPLPGNLRDLFRVAYRFLAARSDDAAPMTVRDALAFGLESLSGSAARIEGSLARNVARAFADSRSIDPSLFEDGPLDLDPLLSEMRQWFANEIEALTKRTGKARRELTPASERTLRNWRQKYAGLAE